MHKKITVTLNSGERLNGYLYARDEWVRAVALRLFVDGDGAGHTFTTACDGSLVELEAFAIPSVPLGDDVTHVLWAADIPDRAPVVVDGFGDVVAPEIRGEYADIMVEYENRAESDRDIGAMTAALLDKTRRLYGPAAVEAIVVQMADDFDHIHKIENTRTTNDAEVAIHSQTAAAYLD